jgi:hypothetical protein
MEEVLEVGNEDVVERGDESDAEIQSYHEDHRKRVAQGLVGLARYGCVFRGSNGHTRLPGLVSLCRTKSCFLGIVDDVIVARMIQIVTVSHAYAYFV